MTILKFELEIHETMFFWNFSFEWFKTSMRQDRYLRGYMIYWCIKNPNLMEFWFLFWQRHEVWPLVAPNWLQGLAGLTTKSQGFLENLHTIFNYRIQEDRKVSETPDPMIVYSLRCYPLSLISVIRNSWHLTLKFSSLPTTVPLSNVFIETILVRVLFFRYLMIDLLFWMYSAEQHSRVKTISQYL